MILVDNTFDKGPDGWCSYDYHRSMVDGGENYFVLTAHRLKGGVKDSGYVWTDNTRWTADTPENLGRFLLELADNASRPPSLGGRVPDPRELFETLQGPREIVVSAPPGFDARKLLTRDGGGEPVQLAVSTVSKRSCSSAPRCGPKHHWPGTA